MSLDFFFFLFLIWNATKVSQNILIFCSNDSLNHCEAHSLQIEKFYLEKIEDRLGFLEVDVDSLVSSCLEVI